MIVASVQAKATSTNIYCALPDSPMTITCHSFFFPSTLYNVPHLSDNWCKGWIYNSILHNSGSNFIGRNVSCIITRQQLHILDTFIPRAWTLYMHGHIRNSPLLMPLLWLMEVHLWSTIDSLTFIMWMVWSSQEEKLNLHILK